MLNIESVSKSFPLQRAQRKSGGPGRVKVLRDISFKVEAGTTFGLVGESGCGKSTLARVAAGLYRAESGHVRLGGCAGKKPRLQMIFQDPYSSLNPRWRVYDLIAEPILFDKLRKTADQTRTRVQTLLELVGLTPADGAKYPHEFSGGQRQRISIARALAGEPNVLICDEPTSALDVSVQAQILNLLKRLQAEFGLTMLFISHDLAVVRHMADRVGVMYLGRMAEIGPSEQVFADPRHPYTHRLLAAIPRIGKIDRGLVPLEGEVPSIHSPPPGCSFAPRCPDAIEICHLVCPCLTQEGNRVFACHVAAAKLVTAPEWS